MAVRFPWQGSEVNKVFTVPNEAVLLLRAFEKGEHLGRFEQVKNDGKPKGKSPHQGAGQMLLTCCAIVRILKPDFQNGIA